MTVMRTIYFVLICVFTMIVLRSYWLSWTTDLGGTYHMPTRLGLKSTEVFVHHRINDPNLNLNTW